MTRLILALVVVIGGCAEKRAPAPVLVSPPSPPVAAKTPLEIKRPRVAGALPKGDSPGRAEGDGKMDPKVTKASKLSPREKKGGGSTARDDRPQTPSQRPDRKPADEAPPATLRAGALRVAAYQSEKYFISYEADRALQIAGLRKALGKRRLGAKVEPFKSHEGPGSVQHGGQIVAVAVAQQLQTMGWLVDLANPSAMKKVAREIVPAADLSGALAELLVSGEVNFTTATRGDVTVAAINGQVAFKDGSTTIVESRIAAESRVLASEVPAISRRLERATREALRSFVRLLFQRKDLATKLIALVQKR